jgi:hypothetical protein
VRIQVDQQPDAQTGRLQVIEDLSAMLRCEFANGLQLHDDTTEADEVWRVGLSELSTFVFQSKRGLGDKRDAPRPEFQVQSFLIDGLEKARAHGAIDFENRTLDAKDILRMQQAFVWFVWFVVHYEQAMPHWARGRLSLKSDRAPDYFISSPTGLTCLYSREWTSGFYKNCVFRCIAAPARRDADTLHQPPLTRSLQ